MRHIALRALRWIAGPIAALVLSAGLAPAQVAPTDRDEIIHVLNRVTFGPCPGDVEMVEKMGGVRAYLDQQLHPDQIDDSAVDQQLAGFDLLQMSSQQLTQLFQQERKKQLQKQKEQAAAAAAASNPTVAANTPPVAPNPDLMPPANEKTPAPNAANLTTLFRSVSAVSQLQQAKLLREVESKRQLQEVLVDFWSNHFNIDVKKNVDRVLKVADDRDVIRPHIWGSFHDLLEASAKSPAMLIYLDNALSTVPRTVTPREAQLTEAIRDRMMANGNAALAPPPETIGEQKGGINENYGREIMELHTLGVDGGYTQKDVQEVARCFTGWSVDRATGAFLFRPRAHDNGEKIVLGHDIPPGGGIQDGETVLNLLASSPATAHHIALQMCQRFVSDDPSPQLVDRIARVFLQSNGNLRDVTEAILTSPEFLSPSDYGTKIKSPLEFAVSAVRASGSTLLARDAQPYGKLVSLVEGAGTLGRQGALDRLNRRPRQSLNYHILELGEPLFACTPPTGYSEISKTWVSPGALIERLNFALALTEQKVSDVNFDPQPIFAGIDLDKPDAMLQRGIDVLLQGHASPATKKVLQQTLAPPSDSATPAQTINPSKLIALIIGSPDFQRK
jgi:uncharacterized protein (DUF1800 family)